MSKILVIDDETLIRNFCYDLFKREGHEVITAARGDQGLAMIGPEKPDLVLMDIAMPGETGLSLLHKIRAKHPRLPVVVFSGRITAEVEKEAFDAGAVELLTKGLDASELRSKIHKILDAKDR